MNQLTNSGTYIVTVEGQEYIVVIIGSAPMLQISRVFNLSAFVDDGSVECKDSDEVIKKISENPSDFHYRPIDLVTEFQTYEIKNNKEMIKYSQKEYRKWLSYANTLEKPELISKLMLERSDLTYPLCEILVEQLWNDKRNLLR
jgi:hypothetical protein